MSTIVLERGMLHNHDMLSYTIHYKSHNNVVYSGKYHTESHAELLRLEVMPDHVHLLVEVDPQYGIHRLVRASKGRSSRLLRQQYPWLKSRLPTLWTNSYFVSTVGGAPLEVIKQYIENQKRV